MKIVEKVMGSLGIWDSPEPEEEQLAAEEELKSKKGNLVNLPTTQAKQIRVVVVEPYSFDDAQRVAENLKSRKPVVINFENTDKEIAKRMVDFISGTTYALNGSIQKVGNHIFLCAPNNVDVSYSSKEESMDKVVLPWNNK